ncbi:hypothetical protein [Fodinicola feengrottensis]|uniref:hypothetical protein n=1 Tax=Fodinicola feengrottensis TaxID=435914 RepID=UPI0013D72089|nr:hypothetical protein [Fodinicola feengrottensis]
MNDNAEEPTRPPGCGRREQDWTETIYEATAAAGVPGVLDAWRRAKVLANELRTATLLAGLVDEVEIVPALTEDGSPVVRAQVTGWRARQVVAVISRELGLRIHQPQPAPTTQTATVVTARVSTAQQERPVARQVMAHPAADPRPAGDRIGGPHNHRAGPWTQ